MYEISPASRSKHAEGFLKDSNSTVQFAGSKFVTKSTFADIKTSVNALIILEIKDMATTKNSSENDIAIEEVILNRSQLVMEQSSVSLVQKDHCYGESVS